MDRPAFAIQMFGGIGWSFTERRAAIPAPFTSTTSGKKILMKIARINPPQLPNAEGIGYSQISVVEPGRVAYISGQVAVSADGAPVPTDLAEQMKVVARNARAALDALGASAKDIVIARCLVTDLTPERLEQVMPPLLELFDGAKPSLTGFGVAALATPDLQVELELTVLLPD
jgi:enamine deaminase RidA (YjgF/YER057c/UK114 family)